MVQQTDSGTTDREIVVSRVIEGPPRLVFEVFSDESHLRRWWGPSGFSLTTVAFHFVVGGEWEFVMHGPDGTDYPNWIRFQEISPPDRIVLLHGEGPDDPEAFTSVITFVETTNGTEVTLRSVFQARSQHDRAIEEYNAIEGANQTLGRLAAYLTRLRGDWPSEQGA